MPVHADTSRRPAFAKQLRGFLLGALTFTASLLPATARSQQKTDSANNTQTMMGLQATVEPKAVISPADSVFNATLLGQLRQHFVAHASRYKNITSRDVKKLQRQTNARLSRLSHTQHLGVFVIDPLKADIGYALGLSDSTTVHAMLPQDKTGLIDPRSIRIAMSSLREISYPLGRTMTYVTSPCATVNYRDTAEYTLIIPASPIAASFMPPLMNHETLIEYTNLHESAHVTDTVFTFKNIDFNNVDWHNIHDYSVWLRNKTTRNAARATLMSEAYADLFAAGEMTAHRGNLGTLDAIIEWRKTVSYYLHQTSWHLAALRREIDSMGIKKFKRLGEDARQAIYHRLTVSETLTDRQFFLMAYIKTTPPVKVLFPGTDYARAQAFISEMDRSYYRYRSIANRLKQKSSTPYWDAKESFLGHAFARAGAITPAALVESYTRMQQDLIKQARRDKANDAMYREKMAWLKNTFTHVMRYGNFAEENRKRGVDLSALIPRNATR